MRVALGGVGGTVGAMLERAGEEAMALARGAHLAALLAGELRVEDRDIMISCAGQR
jgi:ketopantoate reductase